MRVNESEVCEVLKTLSPRNEEELSLLQFLLGCAQRLHCGTSFSLASKMAAEKGADLIQLLGSLPEDAKKYLHGLVEALDIYQAIHGQGLAIQALTLSDKSVYELRQIRDMCLAEGLRSIY